MNGRSLAVLLTFCSAGFTPAFAEDSKVTVDPSPAAPKPKAQVVHKPKPPQHAKKQSGFDLGSGTSAAETKPSQSIPMDFSSYDKKPGSSETESTGLSGQAAPSLGTNSNGGLSPGMKFGF